MFVSIKNVTYKIETVMAANRREKSSSESDSVRHRNIFCTGSFFYNILNAIFVNTLRGGTVVFWTIR